MSEDLLAKYKSVLEEIKKLDYVKAIIIFGSYAENKTKSLSDLDICILPYYSVSEEKIDNIYSYGNEELDISVFFRLPLSLQYKIITEGSLYYTKEDLTDLKITITNKWFDFRVHLNRMYQERGYLTET